jgi:hypothetical protein
MIRKITGATSATVVRVTTTQTGIFKAATVQQSDIQRLQNLSSILIPKAANKTGKLIDRLTYTIGIIGQPIIEGIDFRSLSDFVGFADSTRLFINKSSRDTATVTDARTRIFINKSIRDTTTMVDLAGVFDGITYTYGLQKTESILSVDALRRAAQYSRTARDGFADLAPVGLANPNVFPAPLNIGSFITSGVNCTLAVDPAVPTSPANGAAMRMTVTGTVPSTNSIGAPQWNLAPAAIGQPWTVRVWLRGSVTSFATISIVGADNAGLIIDGGSPGIDAFLVPQSSWTQISFTYIFSFAAVQKVQVELLGPDDFIGSVIWWDGLEVFRSDRSNQRGFAGTAENLRITDLKSAKQGINTLIQNGNLIRYSQTFTDSSWNLAYMDPLTTLTTAPDGTNTGQLIIPTGDEEIHSIYWLDSISGNTILPRVTYTHSIFAKDAGYSSLSLLFYVNGSNLPFAKFNLTTGVVVSASNCTASIRPAGNGWYRCSIVSTVTITGPMSLFVYPIDGEEPRACDGTSGIYIWGAQAEASQIPGPYVRTTGNVITTYANTAADTDKLRIGTNIAGRRVSGDPMERISLNIRLRPQLDQGLGIKGPTDINIVSNQGLIRNTNYVDIDYIAEDYVGDSRVIT